MNRPPAPTDRGRARGGAGAATRGGFTLIEVLVALAIVAIALGAAIRATGSLAGNNADLRQRALALMSAENRIAELRMARQFPPLGPRSAPCPQGRYRFVCDEDIKSTPNAGFHRAEVRVFDEDDPGHRLAELTGIIPNNL